MSRRTRARTLDDADDIASVIHHRVERATARSAGSGRARKIPRFIAGLIPEAGGLMTADMRHALDERRDLIETRAEATLDAALGGDESWVRALGPIPQGARALRAWRQNTRIIAAYRDRYGITSPTPLGADADRVAQRIDAGPAQAALRVLTSTSGFSQAQPTGHSTRRWLGL